MKKLCPSCGKHSISFLTVCFKLDGSRIKCPECKVRLRSNKYIRAMEYGFPIVFSLSTLLLVFIASSFGFSFELFIALFLFIDVLLPVLFVKTCWKKGEYFLDDEKKNGLFLIILLYTLMIIVWLALQNFVKIGFNNLESCLYVSHSERENLPKRDEVSNEIFCKNDVKLLESISSCIENNKKYRFLIPNKAKKSIKMIFYMHNHESACPEYPLGYPL